FLADTGLQYGLSREDAYRLVQLACFNAFEPIPYSTELRQNLPNSPAEADLNLTALRAVGGCKFDDLPSIQGIIAKADLHVCTDLNCTDTQVATFKQVLRLIFGHDQSENKRKWDDLFKPSNILANEVHLFHEVFGV
ncbi:MAG: hypothetical protein WCT02_02720, partial [Candidatus Paceibacterota bacterium]